MVSSGNPGPTLGPCVAWIDGAEVLACCDLPAETDPALLELVAIEASMLLFELSGRQFNGGCSTTVRPCKNPCGCWEGSIASGIPWFWQSSIAGNFGYPWSWTNEVGDSCGCGTLSRVKLAGYPVTEVTQVLIDGVALDEFDSNGDRQWRLDGWRWLTRMDTPAVGNGTVTRNRWPACQNLALDDDQPGTFSITYNYGTAPPPTGLRAAAQLACQLYASCSGEECQLPIGATRINRQGVTIERGLLANWFDPKTETGLAAVDVFLAAYWSTRTIRRPAVFSPDVQKFARRLGN